MAKILVKTKGNTSPHGKPRVYFTCHPDDFDRYFDRICNDIFKTHDCAIYYTKDMNDIFLEQDKATDLESNNLFVIPVTFKLLTTHNRAMDDDFPFAIEKHIPVLPIMMESGIDDLYSKPDKFDELQYLYPFSNDTTEISYNDKLKRFLESVLISDEMAQKVRQAFDAYIFLSYRKKDRRYANDLMRIIHNNPEYRDIAIWFDEFLTPGESFRENIDRILKSSKLFALLVTPNLLEEPGGKPNFVMGEEYPAALESGIDILPTEMETTNKDELSSKFLNIPECVNGHDNEKFRERLLNSISKFATTANDNPEHNFLIGLAYLDGIDVEVDRPRALSLITSAAEAELPEAMKKLYNMYFNGIGIRLDYREAIKWSERIANYYVKNFGEEHPETLTSLNELAYTYGELGKYEKALELSKKVYALHCKVLGEDHRRTIISLNNLAVTYSELGEYKKALKLSEKVYVLRYKFLGEEHPDTLSSLSNLAAAYSKLGEYEKALELNEKVYTLRCKVLGEEHSDTLTSLNNLAFNYNEFGKYEKALELNEKVYTLRCKVLGEEHLDTLSSLSNLAFNYNALAKHEKALELNKKVYTLYYNVLGEEHPKTLASLINLAATYNKLGKYEKSLVLTEKAYALHCKFLGEDHPITLISLSNLASNYSKLGEYKKALELNEKTYTLRCKVLGEEHPNTLISLSNLAFTYGILSEYEVALKLFEKSYSIHCKVFGKNHPDTLAIAERLKELQDKIKNS